MRYATLNAPKCLPSSMIFLTTSTAVSVDICLSPSCLFINPCLNDARVRVYVGKYIFALRLQIRVSMMQE